MQKNFPSLHQMNGLKQRRLFVGLFTGMLFWWAWHGGEQQALAFDLSVAKSWFSRLAGQKQTLPHKGTLVPNHPTPSIPHNAHAVRPMRFGEGMWLGCVVISANKVLDRGGVLQRVDWVYMQVENRCQRPVLRKGAILVLYDSGGGRRILPFWLLEGKQRLDIGEKHYLRLPALDIKNKKPVAWLVAPARRERNLPTGNRQIPTLLGKQRQGTSFNSSYGGNATGCVSKASCAGPETAQRSWGKKTTTAPCLRRY